MVERNIEMYSDIINLKNHKSESHPHMKMEDRAAQFSPFAALTGHEEAIEETARETAEKRELSQWEKSVLDEKLNILLNDNFSDKIIDFTIFEKDIFKDGGKYITVSGAIKSINFPCKIINLKDGRSLKINDIVDITSDLFPEYK